MTALGGISNSKYVTVIFAKCDNKNCQNFTTKHDLAGSWCSEECFIESESGQRPTRRELLQDKINFNFDLEVGEWEEAEQLGITKMGVPV